MDIDDSGMKKNHIHLLVSFAILILSTGVISLIFYGLRQQFLPEGQEIQSWLITFRHSPFALGIVILVFLTLSFFAVPQFILIMSSILVFGSVLGSIYAFLASLSVACIHFWGAKTAISGYIVRKWKTQFDSLSHYAEHNGFWISLIIRLVPSAPFIVINSFAGIFGISFLAFVLGTGFGILPKILFIGFLGGSIERLFSASILSFGLLFLIAVLWLGLICFSQYILFSRKNKGK